MRSAGRVLLILLPDDLRGRLEACGERPIVVVLASETATPWLENVATVAARAGCRDFVCFGPFSERVHDDLDEILLELPALPHDRFTTTWHDDETAEEVAEFCWNVVATAERTLLVLITDDSESELARALRALARQHTEALGAGFGGTLSASSAVHDGPCWSVVKCEFFFCRARR